MSKYTVRPFQSSDFSAIMALEEQIFAPLGESVLGPYYVRLCCDFFHDTCFVVESGDRIVGYLLTFVRGREAYCTTLAIHPEFQGSRVVLLLLRALAQALYGRVEGVWFTVKPDNQAARALHAVLGAEEEGVVHDFYHEGDDRIVSHIGPAGLERMRARYERLGIMPTETHQAPAGLALLAS